jgi:uncharacterized protein YndB with AHSA1/START domain
VTRAVLVVCALLAPAAPALGEVRFVSATGFVVVNEVVTHAPPEQAWRALVDDVGHWWPADHTWFGRSENLSIDAQAGGCFCERDGERSVEHMRISFVEPPKLLRMTGGLGPLQGMGMYGALDWSIAPRAGGTVITLTYRVAGINPEGFAALAPIVDQVQAQQLGGLARYLAGNSEPGR